MSENNEGVINTPKIEEEGRIDEFPQLITEEIENEVQEELKNEGATDGAIEGAIDGATQKYIKISPTFHVLFLSGNSEQEIYRVFNPQTGTVEERELTDNEKHEIVVKELKESKIRFRPTKFAVKTTEIVEVPRKFGGTRKEKNKTVLTNVTVNQFGSDYRKERRRKNRAQRASRKANR